MADPTPTEAPTPAPVPAPTEPPRTVNSIITQDPRMLDPLNRMADAAASMSPAEVWLQAYFIGIGRLPCSSREEAVGRAHAAVQDYLAAFPLS